MKKPVPSCPEHQFRRYPQLPRRSEVANRESRRRDLPESPRRAAWSERRIGLSQIRVIDHVESIGTQIHAEPLRQLRLFLQSHVHIFEPRVIDDVSPFITEQIRPRARTRKMENPGPSGMHGGFWVSQCYLEVSIFSPQK